MGDDMADDQTPAGAAPSAAEAMPATAGAEGAVTDAAATRVAAGGGRAEAGVLVALVSSAVPVERGRLERAVHAAVSRRGWDARVQWVEAAESWSAALAADDADAFLVMPGEAVDLPLDLDLDVDPDLRAAVGPGTGATTPPIVRFDLGAREFDPSPALVHHVRALGLEGLQFVVPSAIAAARHPAVRVSYGADREQYGDWREPSSALRGEADAARPGASVTPAPIGVLVHGGFYRSRWQAGLMDELAVDLGRRGWASWNLEYRRPDLHGWAATLSDLHAGIARLESLRTAPDQPVVLFGHSAGGQLVLQLAEEIAASGASAAVPVALSVSLAGVVDLVAAHDRYMGEGAVAIALGGSPADLPERYAAASPIAYAHRAATWLLVQGVDDSADLVEMNRRLAASAAVSHPELLQRAGHHFSVIDPTTEIWRATMDRVTELLRPDTDRS
ncbi:alpha/beta hydrolase family protein [Herbiconiux daphne]|uniref:BD-FAE-like domain-containing protein n=1 Tax=Herbiconiux daphne TaxID=2970914 RepID=A0ABT2H3E7_9MICO|nr:hypothetical protein [Herbiconiux daphne]MCS5734434.1 hypothetical protein [Herbiconiux daphne]